MGHMLWPHDNKDSRPIGGVTGRGGGANGKCEHKDKQNTEGENEK